MLKNLPTCFHVVTLKALQRSDVKGIPWWNRAWHDGIVHQQRYRMLCGRMQTLWFREFPETRPRNTNESLDFLSKLDERIRLIRKL
jgi:hypothetical protein